MTNNKNLGKILKQRRLMKELTLQELAAKSGVSASHLGRIENGQRFPSASTLRKIAKPLGFSDRDLFTFAGYLSREPSAIAESQAQTGRLDPEVAEALSQEPVEMQRAMLDILSMLKHIAKGIAQENSESGARRTADTNLSSENLGER